jgi:hypothetical protein
MMTKVKKNNIWQIKIDGKNKKIKKLTKVPRTKNRNKKEQEHIWRKDKLSCCFGNLEGQFQKPRRREKR